MGTVLGHATSGFVGLSVWSVRPSSKWSDLIQVNRKCFITIPLGPVTFWSLRGLRSEVKIKDVRIPKSFLVLTQPKIIRFTLTKDVQIPGTAMPVVPRSADFLVRNVLFLFIMRSLTGRFTSFLFCTVLFSLAGVEFLYSSSRANQWTVTISFNNNLA